MKNSKPMIRDVFLEPGERYNARTGGTFDCISVRADVPGAARLRSITSGVQFIAEGITLFEDGSIDWDKATTITTGFSPVGAGPEVHYG